VPLLHPHSCLGFSLHKTFPLGSFSAVIRVAASTSSCVLDEKSSDRTAACASRLADQHPRRTRSQCRKKINEKSFVIGLPLRYTVVPPLAKSVLERPDSADPLSYLQFCCICCSSLPPLVHSWMRRFRFEEQQHTPACFQLHPDCRHSQGQPCGWRIARNRLTRDHRQRRLRRQRSGHSNGGARRRYRLIRLHLR